MYSGECRLSNSLIEFKNVSFGTLDWFGSSAEFETPMSYKNKKVYSTLLISFFQFSTGFSYPPSLF
jgi:hypothetical protein